MPVSFHKAELDIQALKRIDGSLKTDFFTKSNQVTTAVLSTELFQKRKISLTYHVNIKGNFRINKFTGKLGNIFSKEESSCCFNFCPGINIIVIDPSRLQTKS